MSQIAIFQQLTELSQTAAGHCRDANEFFRGKGRLKFRHLRPRAIVQLRHGEGNSFLAVVVPAAACDRGSVRGLRKLPGICKRHAANSWVRGLLGNKKPGEGGHESLVTQYANCLPPAFWRMSSVKTVAPEPSLKAKVVQAIRNRQSKTAVSSSSAADAMYGLDYEPPNTKEKWLMRSVYWGTILLVAFILWEYVKARQGTESRPLVDIDFSAVAAEL